MDSENTSSGNKPAPFLQKLYKMVDNTNNSFAVTWTNHGLNFLVSNAELFATQILPVYFKHNNFSSFVRQLNMYGFRKISKSKKRSVVVLGESHAWEFSHPHFLQGRMDELVHITRKPKPALSDKSDKSDKASVTEDGEGQLALISELEQQVEQLQEEGKQNINALNQRIRSQQTVVHQLLQIINQRVDISNLQPEEKDAITEAIIMSNLQPSSSISNNNNSNDNNNNNNSWNTSADLKPLDLALAKNYSSHLANSLNLNTSTISTPPLNFSPSILFGQMDYSNELDSYSNSLYSDSTFSGPFISEVDDATTTTTTTTVSSASSSPTSFYTNDATINTTPDTSSSSSTTNNNAPLRRSPRRNRASSIVIQEVFSDDTNNNNSLTSPSSSSSSSSITSPSHNSDTHFISAMSYLAISSKDNNNNNNNSNISIKKENTLLSPSLSFDSTVDIAAIDDANSLPLEHLLAMDEIDNMFSRSSSANGFCKTTATATTTNQTKLKSSSLNQVVKTVA